MIVSGMAVESIRAGRIVTPTDLSFVKFRECLPEEWMFGLALETAPAGQLFRIQKFEMELTKMNLLIAYDQYYKENK